MSAMMGAGQRRDHRAVDLAGDRLHRLEVAGRGDREAGLDHVDPESRQLLGDLELLLGVQGDARRLLAIAQRRVEDQYSVRVLGNGHVRSCRNLVLRLLGAGLAATCGRPRAIPPGGGGGEAKAELERSRTTGGRSTPSGRGPGGPVRETLSGRAGTPSAAKGSERGRPESNHGPRAVSVPSRSRRQSAVQPR